jgi:hypothetical protein
MAGNYLKKCVKKHICELVWFLWFFTRTFWGQGLSVFQEQKPLTMYERHQIVICELEIWAVGTDFSRRTSRWAREDPGRARTWKSMRNPHSLKCIQLQQITNNDQNHRFLDKTGCILNEKMMPDITIMVPELEIDNSKKQHGTSIFQRRNFWTLRPQTLQFLIVF